ncbi:MAG: hypothetical protein H6737_23170 [Alphaproteobacteria bacterium]|nr:hypothetical protein [Alphaproteobacteria bacterium]
MNRLALYLSVASAFAGVLCACGGTAVPGASGNPDVPVTPGDLPTTSDGEWAHSVAEGIPCGQMLDCLASCDNQQACLDECYLAADPQARVLVDALDDCWGANGCQDRSCLEAACPQQLQACESQVPPGGVICYASGVYETCYDGTCNRYDSTGGGWGSTVEHGEFWASFYCSQAMNESILVASLLDQYAGIVQQCAPTHCEAN